MKRKEYIGMLVQNGYNALYCCIAYKPRHEALHVSYRIEQMWSYNGFLTEC